MNKMIFIKNILLLSICLLLLYSASLSAQSTTMTIGSAIAQTGNTISIKLKDKESKLEISGTAKLNADLNEMISSYTVKEVPGHIGLSQNYPNLFNPSTTIKYQIAKDSRVSLTVYDILGQKVKTLENGLQQAGYYNITWDGTNDIGKKAAAGIYIYRLLSGNFIKTLKMNLPE